MPYKRKRFCCGQADDEVFETSRPVNISAPFDSHWLGGGRNVNPLRLARSIRQNRDRRSQDTSYITVTHNVTVETVEPHEQLEYPVSIVEISGGRTPPRRNIVPRFVPHGQGDIRRANAADIFPYPGQSGYEVQHTSTELSDGSRRLSSLLVLPSMQRVASFRQPVRPVSRFSWASTQADTEQPVTDESTPAITPVQTEQMAKNGSESTSEHGKKLKKKSAYTSINGQAQEDASVGTEDMEEQDHQANDAHTSKEDVAVESDEKAAAQFANKK